MGTDVWLLTEIQDESGWRPLRGEFAPRKGPRNYVLFSILGDVRNRAGRHAPVWQKPHAHTLSTGEQIEIPGFWYDTEDGGHDPLIPISEPRGVPDDASEAWKKFVEFWHARTDTVDVTWVTPEEILSADWDQAVYSEGIVTEEEYIELFRSGKGPSMNASDVGGRGVRIVTEVEYAAGVRGDVTTAIKARWKSGVARDLESNFIELAREITESRQNGEPKLRFMLLFES